MGYTAHIQKARRLSLLVSRSEGVRKGLLAAYEAGRGSPNEVAGNEREVFVKNYLEAAYPKPFRFASGVIMDHHGTSTGQLDIVIERANSLSLPGQASGDQRLYFAEMVSSVISVKSNLNAQWSQVASEMDKIAALNVEHASTIIFNELLDFIPTYVVAYSGAASVQPIYDKIEKLKSANVLRGVLVLDTQVFMLQSETGKWIDCSGENGFLSFIADLHYSLSNNFGIGESMWPYVCEMSKE